MMPRNVPIAPASTTSAAESTSRGPTIDHTESPFASEVPSLPVKSPEAHDQY